MTSFRGATKRRAIVAIAVATLGGPVVARADPLTRSVAQVLFDDGRALMQAGRYAEACAKLGESERLEPAAGTLLNLALCHEYEGKTASAWLAYVDAIALAAQEQNVERQRLARERLAALEPALSRLRLVTPSGLPRGYWVELDGLALKPTTWDAALPVDRGPHQVRYGAPGHVEQQASFTVNRSGTHTLALQVPPLVIKNQRHERPPGPTITDTGWKVAAGSGLGLGVVGLATASYFGVKARDAWRERNQLCDPSCSRDAARAGGRAQDFARTADVLAVVGVLGLGTTAVAWWLRPRPRSPAPAISASLGAQHSHLVLKGSF